MKFLRFLLFPFALIYGLIVLIRNLAYDTRFFKSSKFSLPIINIGNLSMGGTGKTPHTEYLIRLLKDKYKVATLSRGFGRKEYGFKIADEDATANSIGDEPLQYFKKYGDKISVAVESNRVHGVMDLCREKEETNLILLDDAYQHRAIHAGLNILITSYYHPFYEDFILPIGNLREFRNGKKRANIIIVSKCPDFKKLDKVSIVEKIKPTQSQCVFFSRIKYGQIMALDGFSSFDDLTGQKVILVTGIANADSLKSYISEKNEILHHFNFNDHHKFTVANLTEIHNLFDKFASPETILITTEKDAMRLLEKSFEEELKKYPWYYQTIEVAIDEKEKFDKLILDYAEKNN